MSKKNSINPASVAIAGLAVGAAAGAAAVALSDKNTRKKIEKKLDGANQQAQDMYDKASKKLDTAVKIAEPRIKDALHKFNTSNGSAKTQHGKSQLDADSNTSTRVDQVDEVATKGGEVNRHNMPEKNKHS